MKTAKLGDKARCKVSGFVGVVVAATTWLNGCVRLTLQPAAKKDGTLPETQTFDVDQLSVVKAGYAEPAPSNDGGPVPNPTQHKQPIR